MLVIKFVKKKNNFSVTKMEGVINFGSDFLDVKYKLSLSKIEMNFIVVVMYMKCVY